MLGLSKLNTSITMESMSVENELGLRQPKQIDSQIVKLVLAGLRLRAACRTNLPTYPLAHLIISPSPYIRWLHP